MSLENISGPDAPAFTNPPAGAIGQRQAITLTSAAISRVKELLAQKSPAPEALIIGVTSKGCSGFSYDIQYLDLLSNAPKYADKVTQDGVTVVIDPKAALYILGSTMDYQTSKLKAGFDFINPNETGRCGCGESFSVDPKLAGK